MVDLLLSSRTSDGEVMEFSANVSSYIGSLFNYTARPFTFKGRKRRIFCIGWPKTGTTSIAQALRMLGIYTWHYAPWIAGYNHFSDDISKCNVDFDELAKFNAISDTPIPLLYRELDEVFPGSLFIHTTRAVETWLSSAIAEVQTAEERGLIDVMYYLSYGTDKVHAIDKKRMLERYIQHDKDVVAYFSGRSHFLSIDVTRGNPWESLCRFVGIHVPSTSFPHLNRRSTS